MSPRPHVRSIITYTLGAMLLTAVSGQAAPPLDGLLTDRDIKYCAEVGAFAATAARARDRGVPLTRLLALPTVAGQDPALTKLMQSIQFDVYEHSWWTPDYARQQWEVPCIHVRRQAVKD